MPEYLYVCRNLECPELGIEKEIRKRMLDPSPICECGWTMERVIESGAGSFALPSKGWFSSGYDK
jgi:hypothetical protein